MFLNKFKGETKISHSSEEIGAFLGKESCFEGKITFLGIFRLDGKFEGEIFDSGTLIVGETALIRGKISANTIIINGHVEGEIFAKERVEIHSKGKFYGDLVTPVLTISEGAFFEGHCKMVRKDEREIKSDFPIQNQQLR